MQKIYIYLTCVLFASCSDFVDVTPEGILTPTTVEDYKLILANNINASRLYANSLILSTDESFIASVQTANDDTNILVSPLTRAFLWFEQFNVGGNGQYTVWNSPYSTIYDYNLIINNIDHTPSAANEKEQNQVKGNALINRALEYLGLVNTFAQPYGSETINSPGVPYLTQADITQRNLNRETLTLIYPKIIADIEEAISLLPEQSTNELFNNASKIGAKSLLARVYYYMRDFEKASEIATEVLAVRNTLYDLNVTSELEALINNIPEESIEELFVKRAARNTIQAYLPNEEFLNEISDDDFRKTQIRSTIPFNARCGTSIGEMMLIRAEAYARQNNLPMALAELNALRIKRIKTDAYVPFNATNQEEVINRILFERKIELAFRFLRWFDLRHMAKEGRIGVLAHSISNEDGNIVETATLAPDSPRYTWQIPILVLSFNPEMPQNP